MSNFVYIFVGNFESYIFNFKKIFNIFPLTVGFKKKIIRSIQLKMCNKQGITNKQKEEEEEASITIKIMLC